MNNLPSPPKTVQKSVEDVQKTLIKETYYIAIQCTIFG